MEGVDRFFYIAFGSSGLLLPVVEPALALLSVDGPQDLKNLPDWKIAKWLFATLSRAQIAKLASIIDVVITDERFEDLSTRTQMLLQAREVSILIRQIIWGVNATF